MSKNIVFIDSRVSGYQTLIASLSADSEWYLLDATQDGLEQMQRVLECRTALDSIHVVSHGSAGTLYLGSTVLNSGNLHSYESQFRSIGASLTTTGDILLYGCNVAQGTAGAGFVDALARITGADVAASNDPTGLESSGGDAVLEVVSGSIETQALSLGSLQQTLVANTAPTFTVSDGKLMTDFGGSVSASSVVQLADGKLVVAGSTYSNGTNAIVLARYNADGTLDTSFGGDGELTTSFASSSEAVIAVQQADGKLVAAGGWVYGFALGRYNADGTLDTRFDGYSNLSLSMMDYAVVNSIFQQADGKLVVVWDLSNGRAFELICYNTDGTLDTSFDGDGKLRISTDFPTVAGHLNSVLLQEDGKLVVAGVWNLNDNSRDDFYLARYNADGTLDTDFDADGKLTTDFGSSSDSASKIFQQADGKLVVAGSTYSNGNYAIALARYNADGTLDTSFDGDGKQTTTVGSGASVSSILQQADGKLVVAGSFDDGFALVRYNMDGSLDTTFSAPEDTLHLRNPTVTEYRYSWDSAKVVLAPEVRIFDAELSAAGHYTGSSLTLSRQGGANAEDVFGGTGTLSTLPEGGYFAVDSVTIGRVTVNSAGTLKLSFNSNATQSLVDKALQQIGYANLSDAPPASVQIDWVFSDGNVSAQGSGGALSVTGSSTVTITATNDAPISSGMLQNQTALANSAFSYTLPASAFSDPDQEALKYSVNMADGSGLPPWLKINAATGTLSGTPESLDTGSFMLRITASDASGATASSYFTLTVTASSRAIEGTAGNDSLIGQDGNDILKGYAGNDTLDGGVGSDNMEGGDGSDLYYVDNNGDVVVESNASSVTGGIDTVYSSLASYTLVANVENGRILSPGNASLSGNGLDNLLYAGAGDNTLDGQGGADTVSYLYAAEGVTVSLAKSAAQDTESSGVDRLLNIENLTGSAYDDQLTGNNAANILDGGAGADVMIGRSGDDIYYVDDVDDVVVETSSSGGEDIVYSTLQSYTLTQNVENGRIITSNAANLTGNSLSNVLYAGAGNNVLNGGAGTDTVSYLYGLISAATSGVNASLATGVVSGSSDADTLLNIENLTGSSLNDTLAGNAGRNVLNGGAGDDSLSGGDGNDTLIGGTGKDTLIGGAGTDLLTGGDGNDIFKFTALTDLGLGSLARDVITDFKSGQDKIDLAAIDPNSALRGDQAFVWVTKFNATAGQVRFAADGQGNGIVYLNTDRDADAEFEIMLTGVTTLTAADLVL